MLRSNDNEPLSAPGSLAQQLRMFALKIRRRLLAQGDPEDLRPSQWGVLRQLEKHGPATTSALARAEGMRSQSMGTIVAALEEAGLVVGTPDPADGRQTLLAVTDHYHDWISRGRAARQDWLARTVEARLTPAERQRLAEVMPLLLRLVSDPDEC